MNDEQAVRRGQQASQALEYLAPVLDGMTEKALAELLDAAPADVLQRQLYAKAIADLRKTIEAHIRAGDFAARVSA